MKKLRILFIRFILYGLVVLLGIALIKTYRFSSQQLRVPSLQTASIPVDVIKRSEMLPSKVEALLKSDSAAVHLDSLLGAFFPELSSSFGVHRVPPSSVAVHWQGRNPRLRPIVLIASLNKTQFRGLECLEAMLMLQKEGFQPERSMYLTITLGEQIDPALSAWLSGQELSYEFVLREGGGISKNAFPGLEQPLALIGVGEVSDELQTEGAGTASAARTNFLRYVGPELRFFERMLVANPRLSRRWLEKHWKARTVTRDWQPGQALASKLSGTQTFGFRTLQQTVQQVFAPVVVAPGLIQSTAEHVLLEHLSEQLYLFSPPPKDTSPEAYEQSVRFYRWLIWNGCQ